MFRRSVALCAVAVSAVALAGCTTGSTDAPASSSAVASTGTTEPAPATEAPAPVVDTVQVPCPYLSQDFMELTVGQRLKNPPLVTTTTPPPGPLPKCEFQRASGEAAAVIDSLTIEAGTGLTRALEFVPGGNPVDVGEGGSVLVHQGEDRTDLAAFSGTTMILITINQESSLEAKLIAEEALKAVGAG